jgi:3D (Asp-Asp-Asp) domain-containing protein
MEYVNRYNDTYTFTLDEDNNILWKGSFSSPQINGKWVVHDCMNKRYSNSVDLLFDAENNNPKLGVCRDLVIKI